MSCVHLYLLGPPEIRVGEQPIRINRRLPRALLFYLAERRQPVSRETLLSILWKEEDIFQRPIRQRRRHLNVEINRLKKALPAGVLHLQPQTIALNHRRLWVDLWQFRDRCAEARDQWQQFSSHNPLPRPLVEKMESALALWRGRCFLEGARLPDSPFLSNWLTGVDDRLTQERLEVIRRLVWHYRQMGLFDAALQYVHEWLDIEPLDVSAHAQLITLHRLAGRPEAADAHLARLVERLEQEQESPDLLRYLQNEVIRLSGGGAPKPLAPAEQAPARQQVPLIGKDLARAKLLSAIEKGRGAILQAPVGMGKSLLVKRFLEDQRLRALIHRCRPDEWQQAYATLEAILLQAPNTAWKALSPLQQDALRALRSAQGAASEKPTAEALYQATQALLAAMSRETPLVLWLDDAHGMDVDTARLLLRLQTVLRRRLPVILTLEGGQSAPLEPVLADARMAGWEHIVLHPLTAAEARKMMVSRLGDAVSDAFARFFYEKSGGNPALLDDLLQDYLQQHPDSHFDVPPHDVPYPAFWVENYRRRAAVLSPQRQQLLALLALYSRPVGETTLASLLDVEPTALRWELEHLAAGGWIRRQEAPDDSDLWLPVCDLVRQVVLNILPPEEQRRLHRRVYEALSRQSLSEEDALRRIAHLEQAGEPVRAIEEYVRLAGQHLHEGRLAAAHRVLQQAENVLWRQPETVPDELAYRLYELWDFVLAIGDRPDEMQAVYRRLFQLASRRNSSLLLGMAMYGLSDVCLLRNRFEEGLSYAQAAIQHLENAGYPLRQLWARVLHAVHRYMLGQIGPAHAVFREVLDTLQTLPPSEETLMLRSHVHYQIALMETLCGRPRTGLEHSKQALGDAQAVQDVFSHLLLLNNLALASFFLADYEEARRYSQQAVTLAEDIRSMRFLGYAYLYRAMVTLVEGDVEQVVSLAYRAIALGKVHRHQEIEAFGHRLVGEVYLWLEAPSLALEYFRKAERLAGNTFLMPDLLMRIGITLLRQRLGTPARERLQMALEQAQSVGMDYVVITTHLAWAELLLSSGEWERARARAVDTARMARARGLRPEALQADLLTARALWHLKAPAEALQTVECVVGEGERLGHFWITLNALRLWFRWLQARGEETEALRKYIGRYLARLHQAIRQPQGEVVTDTLPRTVVRFIQQVQQEML